MEYKIMIDVFEGPMDLLLHLIDRAEIDIYDIPISLITDQFIEYLHKMEELNLEITSDFLVMAATLLEIKSKMLLPQREKLENNQLEMEEVDPRAELVRKLVEYKKYKHITDKLREMESIQSKVYYKPKEDIIDTFNDDFELVDLNIDDLLKALNNIIIRRNKKAKVLDVREIQREEYTLEKCVSEIKERLNRENTIYFSDLLKEDSTKSEIITYFLSILELINLKYIHVVQEEDFSDLIITKK
ncbi:MAG: segregation/condensation protein A [Tissierellia bacterium]|nr:segregation/condensation protein A [Tissierellia bacterium]